MGSKIRVAGVCLFLLAITGLILLLVHPGLDPARIAPLPLIGAAWIAFAVAAWLLRKVAARAAVALVLLGGIGIQLAALSAPPQESSDLYRYMWDGRVQDAGIDPYEYAPAAAGVAGLRDDFLWSPVTGKGHYVDCVVLEHKDPTDPGASLVPGCTKLNRPRVPTIYPPVAEAYFLAVQAAAPADNSTTPIQAAAVACALLTTVVLLLGLRKLGKDVRLAALWAWCPLVALEAGNSAHVDVLAVAITTMALLVLSRAKTEGRTMLGGVLLGLAIATKVTPVLIVPSLLRRRWFMLAASAATAIIVVYAPHAMAVGSKIVGFLPGYLNQEGYSTGSGFDIVNLLLHGKAAILAAALLLAVIALAVLRYGDPDRPWQGSVVMTGAAIVVATPHYQWYALLLVMLVVLDGRPEWLAIAAAGYLPAEPGLGPFTLSPRWSAVAGYGAAALFVCAVSLLRYLRGRRQTPAPEPATAPAAPVLTALLPAAGRPGAVARSSR